MKLPEAMSLHTGLERWSKETLGSVQASLKFSSHTLLPQSSSMKEITAIFQIALTLSLVKPSGILSGTRCLAHSSMWMLLLALHENDIDDVWYYEYLSYYPYTPKSSEKDKVAAACQHPRKLIAQERVDKRME